MDQSREWENLLSLCSSSSFCSWNTRMKISLGTAKAISSIHTSNSTHGNIKSSNILLSQELNPLITDVGLNPLTTTTSRSNGYQAPELHHETTKIIITQKSDVYSFGVLLLEILTGKIPLMVDLPRWVRSVVREEWTGEVFDEELLLMTMRGECGNFEEEEMVLMLQIAMACVDKRDDQRPEMDEVVRNIEEIRSCHEMKIRVESDSESNVQTH